VAGASIPINKFHRGHLRAWRKTRTKRTEEGIALLISIFILLLIGVVAIALIVASGTETALAGNYRSSTGVYYAALAGLEEARSRLGPQNPSYFGNTSPGFLPSPGTQLPVGSPVYMINPLLGENVTPWDSTSVYADKEYNPEFASTGFTLPPSPPWTYSVWNTGPLNGLPFPGPLYKWVRINAVSEKSLSLPVAPWYPNPPNDSSTPVFYDGTHLNNSGTGAQVLEITSLAVLPNGSQKLLQYLVAPTSFIFPAALTIAGTNVTYTGPSGFGSDQFQVVGTDGYGNGSCAPMAGPPSPFAAIGYTANDSSQSNILGGISWPDRGNYTGSGSSPSVNSVAAMLPPNFMTPSGLNALVATITANADVVVTAATADYGALPSGMSATNPMTTVIQGSLNLDGWTGTGYGLLLVTGDFNWDPASSWKGVILVIGNGSVSANRSGPGEIIGAMFAATTVDSNGILLPDPNLGQTSVLFTSGMRANGILYSSCWITTALSKAWPATSGAKILSFHEIAQQ